MVVASSSATKTSAIKTSAIKQVQSAIGADGSLVH